MHSTLSQPITHAHSVFFFFYSLVWSLLEKLRGSCLTLISNRRQSFTHLSARSKHYPKHHLKLEFVEEDNKFDVRDHHQKRRKIRLLKVLTIYESMELPLTISKVGAEGASVDSSRKEDSFVVLGHSSSQKNRSSSANTCYYEGERLTWLLQSIQRKIELVRADASLPEKIWFKQQFSIGVNEVTRVLERMAMPHNSTTKIQLQALLVASDSNPRWLTKHLPSLALSRKVPLFILKDNKQASLRLGQLVHLKTAIVIGVKDKHNSINQLFAEILANDFTNAETQ
ncbi:uncharacterized protein LOC133028960 isoform X3 [Cannabis sativa]|uniref:uncharacterized protein LOC133028960 isoform X3 n=1 Tax=Cannabis sativa TaxID=3483 RepID=UPI0029C9B9A6|nr:uncharacterized protein LOC133028960 isoform X3 [Cannabis sativa]